MAEILFEIGCEELPASFIGPALEQLQAEIASRLQSSGLAFDATEAQGTPRRLVVSFNGVPVVQPDQQAEHRGPALTVAFDSTGQPTKALEGFCRGHGVQPTEVVKEGEHVWVRKTVKGQATRELLASILPEALFALQFKKSMRWAGSKMRFARPIRWLLAAFDGGPVNFEIEGIRSGVKSRGHRFLSPVEFDATTFAELESKLRQNKVELRKSERVERIRTAILAASPSVQLTEALIEENANLTEWPEAHKGEFKAEFLELPAAVLTTVMAKHERFFPVADGENLTNSFVAVRNGGEAAVVSEGNAWVLNARFNDARFFFEEDKKHSLDDFLDKTSGMTFQEKLGSVRQRADRLANLAEKVALWSGASAVEAALAKTAGQYAKADLSAGLVSELDELQGVIGGVYARRENYPDAVCWALSSQYDPELNLDPQCEGARTAVRLIIADQLDKLGGFLGLGFVPKGSSDPYGLRRAATMLIEAAWNWPSPLPSLESVLETALDGYAQQGFELDRDKAVSSLTDVLGSRYESLIEGRYDIVKSAVMQGGALLNPRAVRFRAGVMAELAQDTGFVNAATRPANILESAKKKGISFETAQVTSETLGAVAADALWSVVRTQRPLAEQAAQAEDRAGLIQALRPLVPSINDFFDSTMVMVDDTAVRDARLNLLSQCDSSLKLAGDFTMVVIEG